MAPIAETTDLSVLTIPEREIDAIFTEWDSTRSPGCAVGVYHGEQLVFARGYGMANLEHGVPIGPRSIFHVASISKQFTNTCIALLAAAGQLSVDDDVRTYVPEVPDFGHSITLRHLIHHTSGLRDQWSLLNFAGWRDDDLITDADVLDMVHRQVNLNFPPGDRHLYCNTGYTLLAAVVHRVSGQTLREFAQAQIFAPLKMTRTHFHDNHREIVPGRTQAYKAVRGGWEISIPVFDVVGTTSLFTTVEDLHAWYRNFSEPVIGGPEVMAQLLVPGTLNDGTTLDYAWGLVHRTHRGAPVIEHSGADAGYRAHVMRFPEHDLGVAVLANADRIPPVTLAEQVAGVVLGARLAALPAARPSPIFAISTELGPIADLGDLAGIYRSESGEEFLRLIVENDQLKTGIGRLDDFVRVGLRTYSFTPYPRLTIEFAAPQPGVMPSFARGFGGDEDAVRFHWLDAISPPASALDELAGHYTCDEIGATYELRVTNGQLALHRRRFAPAPLVAAGTDTFVTDAFHGTNAIRVTRDVAGAAESLTLSSGRVSNLRFQRHASGHL